MRFIAASLSQLLLAPLYMDTWVQEPMVGHGKMALQNMPKELDEIFERAIINLPFHGCFLPRWSMLFLILLHPTFRA
jgi:hypothetical protein